MRQVRWARWGVLALVLFLVGGLTWALLRSGGGGLELAARKPNEKASAKGGDSEYVTIGGVKRRRSDFEAAKPPEASKEDEEKARLANDYGRLPMVPLNVNKQAASVAEAIREKKHPERLSMLARPAAFDPKAYQANPDAYLNVVEPARVFQTAQPGPKVPRLRLLGSARPDIAQGSSTPLRVLAPPGSPVTFSSFDAGEFENRLTSITVQADKQGVAEAKFLATPGTISRVHILAGSPVAAGQARFVVNVTRGEAPAANANAKPGG